jgi:hypothetical protein
LHDPELRLAWIGGRHRAAFHTLALSEGQKPLAPAPRPTQRPLHGRTRRGFVRWMRQAFVEHHRDVGSELRLDVGRLFRREEMA